jgi:uncharacterized protein YndB with AHSA1/START domain
MDESRFVYVTYIRTTPEKLWHALTDPGIIRKYWFGATQESEWKPGAAWKIILADGRIADTGEVLEIDPPKRLVLRWRHEFMPELKAEGDARATYVLEPAGDAVKLTVIHEIATPGSKLIEAVSGGWPKILASLKSLLETGSPLGELNAA